MKRLALLLILTCSIAQAQEVVVSYDNGTLPVLNEELRRNRERSRSNESSISTLQTDVAALEANFPVSIANGGTGQITAQAAIDALTDAASADNGDVWTSDGTNGSFQPLPNSEHFTAGTSYLLGSADTVRTGNQTSYTLKKAIIVPRSGNYTVKFSLQNGDNDPAHTSFARIYKDGVAVGTERTDDTVGYTEYSENISTDMGDTLQLYAYNEGGGAGGSYDVKEFRVYALEPNSFTTLTD